MIERIIFLDIDGVLNPVHYMAALGRMWKESSGEIKSQDDYGHLFFPHNCEALKKIINETGAKLVISSTWRLAGIDVMKNLWSERDLAGEIIGVTPTETAVVKSGGAEFYDQVCRGMEIAHWIKVNDFKGSYVIIDDTHDMLSEQLPYFIDTKGNIGLTFKDADRAIDVLLNTTP